jgi:DNA-binding response OmpR family regulator
MIASGATVAHCSMEYRMSKLLLGESDKNLVVAMQAYFSRSSYTVHAENSGLRVLGKLLDEQFSVIVMQTTLPGMDGISVVRRYRASGGTTPIVLTADKHSSSEMQSGLDAGADAYLVKPFEIPDLAAQLRALLRRPILQSVKMVTSGGIEMDIAGGTVTRDDIAIHLHPMEFKLLEFLMTHPNQVFSAHALFERVWQKDFGLLEDTVRTHVRTLRQKIDAQGCASIITTVRGLGYKTEHR